MEVKGDGKRLDGFYRTRPLRPQAGLQPLSAIPRFASAHYIQSVHDPAALPPAAAPEVAFVGRSNAGKSSALNALCEQKRLAFVSKTPGRTQLINFFAIGSDLLLVDLPGYGFAGVPHAVRSHWSHLVGTYVGERASLAGVVLLMDCRHPLTAIDREVLAWLRPAGRRLHVLLSKADKLSTQAGQRVLTQTRTALIEAYPGATVQLFSALRRKGIEETRAHIAGWLGRASDAGSGMINSPHPHELP